MVRNIRIEHLTVGLSVCQSVVYGSAAVV